MPDSVRAVCQNILHQISSKSPTYLHTVAVRGHSGSSSKSVHLSSASQLLSQALPSLTLSIKFVDLSYTNFMICLYHKGLAAWIEAPDHL